LPSCSLAFRPSSVGLCKEILKGTKRTYAKRRYIAARNPTVRFLLFLLYFKDLSMLAALLCPPSLPAKPPLPVAHSQVLACQHSGITALRRVSLQRHGSWRQQHERTIERGRREGWRNIVTCSYFLSHVTSCFGCAGRVSELITRSGGRAWYGMMAWYQHPFPVKLVSLWSGCTRHLM